MARMMYAATLCRLSIVLLLALAGCRGDRGRRPPVAAAPVLSPLEVADRHYQAGEYAQAADAYRAILQDPSAGADPPQVLFRLAMSQLLLDPGPEGQQRTLELLRGHAAAEGGESTPSEAAVLLELLEGLEKARSDLRDSQRQARRLAAELEKLREIDLRRRPPS